MAGKLRQISRALRRRTVGSRLQELLDDIKSGAVEVGMDGPDAALEGNSDQYIRHLKSHGLLDREMPPKDFNEMMDWNSGSHVPDDDRMSELFERYSVPAPGEFYRGDKGDDLISGGVVQRPLSTSMLKKIALGYTNPFSGDRNAFNVIWSHAKTRPDVLANPLDLESEFILKPRTKLGEVNESVVAHPEADELRQYTDKDLQPLIERLLSIKKKLGGMVKA